MARINIETSLYTDNRFINLILKKGGLEPALGALVRAWIVAQKFYVTESKSIPLSEWKNQNLAPELIEVGLAVQDGDFIRMKGADDQFGWLQQRVEAGRRGGLKKAQKTLAVAKRSPSKRKQTLASYSYSLSINTKNTDHSYLSDTHDLDEQGSSSTEVVKNSQERKPATRGGSKRTPEQAARIQRFVAEYVKAYRAKFGEGRRPEDMNDPKIIGQIANFAKDHPDIERACELVQVYFQLDEKWFETKGYDFLTFRNNLAKIGQALDSGMRSNGINWEKVFGEISTEKKQIGSQS